MNIIDLQKYYVFNGIYLINERINPAEYIATRSKK